MTETSFRTPVLSLTDDISPSSEEDDTQTSPVLDTSPFARRKSCGGASHTSPRVRSLDTACADNSS